MVEKSYPEPTVGALIFNPEGKIFLMRTYKWADKYAIPGGHIELGETIEDALRREVKEETGLDIYDIEFFSLQESIFDKNFWKKKHFLFLDFVCKTKSLEVKLNEEGQEYVWVSLENALNLPLDSYTRRLLEAYRNRQEPTAIFIKGQISEK